MSIQQLNVLLGEYAGLNPDATPGVTERAVQNILEQKPGIDVEQYYQLVQRSNEEMELLLDQIVVPETWFFRYPDAFTLLQNWVLSTWLPNRRQSRLKILSVPCSTGEEPYSVAIALQEAGLPIDRFTIVAADISTRALKQAKAAVYNRHSFREPDSGIRGKYFSVQSDAFHLSETVRSTVKFHRWNVQHAPPIEITGPYDVIFCRNLFIYLHRAAQKNLMTKLSSLLSNQGLLFAGHAEAGYLLSPAFKPLPPLKAFVHCKL